MICNNCKNEIKPGELYCGKCGNRVVVDNQNNFRNTSGIIQNNMNVSNNNVPSKKSIKNIVSLVIGIITIFGVFIFQIFTMPLSAAGIIFGVLSYRENKKNIIGLILNAISFIIAIPIFLLYSYLISDVPANALVGTWNCKSFSGNGEGSNYVVTMKINNDNKFIWGKYDDLTNNYVIGNYDFEELEKNDNKNIEHYYSLTLDGSEYVTNGKLQNEKYKSTYQIMDSGDESLLFINVSTYNMYSCYLVDESNPEIETNYSDDYDKDEEENNIRINRLTYKLPSGLVEGTLNSDTYKSYSYMNENAFCKFIVYSYELNQNMTIEKYYDEYVFNDNKDLTKIYTKNINGSNWFMLDVDGEYSVNKYGVYLNGNESYLIDFSITDDYNNECLNFYNNILGSLKIN